MKMDETSWTYTSNIQKNRGIYNAKRLIVFGLKNIHT